MRRALVILALLTLLSLLAAIVGQALVYRWGVTYSPEGQPTNPTPQAYAASDLAGFGALLSMPLAFVTFILGIVATANAHRYGWLTALLVAGFLALAGLVAMAWILLSSTSPLAFQTPLVLVPLVTLPSALFPTRRAASHHF
jgi:hypothetical protein